MMARLKWYLVGSSLRLISLNKYPPPPQKKKKKKNKFGVRGGVGPPLSKLSGSAHFTLVYLCSSTVWFEYHRHMVIKVEDRFSPNVARLMSLHVQEAYQSHTNSNPHLWWTIRSQFGLNCCDPGSLV